MKRRISVLLLATLLVSVLFGCGAKSEDAGYPVSGIGSDGSSSGQDAAVSELPDTLPDFEPLDWSGVEDAPAGDFTYEIREGTDPVTGEMSHIVKLLSYIGDDNIIKIPDMIEGYRVVWADIDMFHDNTSITYICLPSNLYIYNAEMQGFFRNCTSLVQVQMPVNCYTLPDGMFSGCTSLRAVTFPSSEDAPRYPGFSVGKRAFLNCTSLTSIELPSDVHSIDNGAFQGCIRLETINIESVEGIGFSAFEGCASLRSLKAPNATTVAGEAFMNCVNLTELELSAYNLSHSSDRLGAAFNGCTSLQSVTFVPSDEQSDEYLIMEGSKIYRIHNEPDGSTTSDLIRVLECYQEEDVTLREDCVIIRSYAFDNIPIETFDIPASVEKVESYAFNNCPRLKKVSEEAGVKNIFVDDSAFDCCPLLQIIDLSVRPWDPSLLSGTRKDDIYGYSCPALEAVYLPGDDPNAAPLTKDSITAAIEAVFDQYADEMNDAGFTYDITCERNAMSQVFIYSNKQEVSGSDSELLKKLALAVISVPEAELHEGLAAQIENDPFTGFQYFNRYFSGSDKLELGCWEDKGCLVILTNLG